MIVRDDSVERVGWALKDPLTGNIYLTEVCESEEDAHALRRGMRIHQSHRGNWQVCAVIVTIGQPAERSAHRESKGQANER